MCLRQHKAVRRGRAWSLTDGLRPTRSHTWFEQKGPARPAPLWNRPITAVYYRWEVRALPGKIQAHVSEYEGFDANKLNSPEAAGIAASQHELPRPAVRPMDISIARDEGTPTVRPERFGNETFSHYSKQELEGLIHVLIYRVDLLLAGLKLADWGNQDFTRTIEETEAILNEDAMYDIGRTMDRMIRALESVAEAAQITARYSMLSPGYSESTEQLEEALTVLREIQRESPVSPQPELESE